MRWPVSQSQAEESTIQSSSQPLASGSGSTPAALPPDHPPVPDGVDKCPVDDSARSVWLSAAGGSAPPHPLSSSSSSSSSSASAPSNPAASLSQARVVSSIPRGAGWSYAHNTDSPPVTPSTPDSTLASGSKQDDGPLPDVEAKGNWVYPSEQQFFNAMMRKNHKPKVADMRTIVPIHNAVNEKAWEEVLAWEAGMGGDRCGGIRLGSFVGRPRDRTPKAWLKTMFGYTPPFDRHDWIVDRCGTHVRYVIDFYTGKPDPKRPGTMAFYLDVRPALDTWEGIYTRLSGLWRRT